MANGMLPGNVGIGIPIVPLDTLIKNQLDADNSLVDDGKGTASAGVNLDAMAGYIVNEFQLYKRAKVNSGIETLILDSVRAYKGEYSSEELGKISSEGGSNIFMNITSTKSRCAKSWLSDIYLNPKLKPWTLKPSRAEVLPPEVMKSIEDGINSEFQSTVTNVSQQGGMSVGNAQQTITDTNETKRDVATAIADEIDKEARFQLLGMEKTIEDQLNEGGFSEALLTFLEDFCIYPAAFMKGPVICKRPKLSWVNGKAVVNDEYYFQNERVSPLDIYPSPDATTTQDGNLIEHLRLSPLSIANLKGVKGYNIEAIDDILTNEIYGEGWLNTGIEQDKVTEEYRGDVQVANENVVHGLHFFGTVPYSTVLEWDSSFKVKGSEKLMPQDILEMEVIVAGGKVIKCNINADPLKRRPYYKASYMNIPGSFWGTSLPSLMSDIQRMCNAAARALANNMALGSGPMAEVYIDRLADNGAISEMKPRMIFQTIPDPTGAGGRAIQFFQPALVANDLLAVYEKFEQKADNVTGIPAYAYGNEKTATAPTTVGGLSILLESTSKIIKDCTRNIDDGLIKPRIEYQFYWNLIYNQVPFTGDIRVHPLASGVLTTKSSEALRRQEFLQITANPIDQGIMGAEGRSEILRVMADDLGLPGEAIPTKLAIRKKIKEDQANQQAAQQQQIQADQQTAQMKHQASLDATNIQIQGQKDMHQGTLALKNKELDNKMQVAAAHLNLDAANKTMGHDLTQQKINNDNQRSITDNATKKNIANQQAALKLREQQNNASAQ